LHENLTNGLVADTRSQKDGRSFLLPLLQRFVKQSEDKAAICTADTAEEERAVYGMVEQQLRVFLCKLRKSPTSPSNVSKLFSVRYELNLTYIVY
jgi:hypothetical protein